MARKAERKNELPTVDFEGVEIMAAGGPIKGIGSPPEGDFYTPDDLRAMAAAAVELGDELRPPSKIGHFPKSGDPAVGWLDNIRVNDDASKLLADVKQVPRKFAEVVKARGYRTRSTELGRFTSQKTGKTYDSVVKGLAWLGAKIPAVNTLDDVVAFYESEEIEAPDDEVTVVAMYEAGDLVWDEKDTLASGIVRPSGKSVRPADTRADMAERKYTDDQRKAFSEATGLEEEKATDEVMAAAGVKLETSSDDDTDTDTSGDGGDGGDGDESGDESARALEAKVMKLEKRVEASDKRAFEAERARVIEAALHDGKFTPGEREGWERRYEAAPDATAEVIDKLPANEDLAREYGSSDEQETESEDEKIDKLYEADAAVRLSIPKEALI